MIHCKYLLAFSGGLWRSAKYLPTQSASVVIKKVSKLLAQLHNKCIKFFRREEATINKQLFKKLGRCGRWSGLPGIDGALEDCIIAHVKIVSTPGCQQHEVYEKMQSDFSTNVQVIVGPRTVILEIVAKCFLK